MPLATGGSTDTQKAEFNGKNVRIVALRPDVQNKVCSIVVVSGNCSSNAWAGSHFTEELLCGRGYSTPILFLFLEFPLRHRHSRLSVIGWSTVG